jgi:hypothetical protein
VYADIPKYKIHLVRQLVRLLDEHDSNKMMVNVSHYWPGGIPDPIKYHVHPVPLLELREEVKGWRQFIEVRQYLPGILQPSLTRDLGKTRNK